MACAIRADEIVDALAAQRWWYGRNALPAPLIARLRAALVAHEEAGLAPAAIGRRARKHLDRTVRGDRIRWLDGNEPSERELLDTLHGLRVELNRRAYFGLVDVEAHFASYAPGTFYRRHVDTFVDSDARVLSFVLYLHDAWHEADGGELVLYGAESLGGSARETISTTRIAPHGGTLVVFESAAVPHEVLPTLRVRRSVAGWFRRRR